MADPIEITGIVTAEGVTTLQADLTQAVVDSLAKTTSGSVLLGEDGILPHAIALYDSSTAVAGARGTAALGTLVGWVSLSEDYTNNVDALRGNRNLELTTRETVDAKTEKYTLVGEFGTVQAVGNIDRMALFGATVHNHQHRKDYESSVGYISNCFKMLGRHSENAFLARPIDATSVANITASMSFSDVTNGRMITPKVWDNSNSKDYTLILSSEFGEDMRIAKYDEFYEPEEVVIELQESSWKSWRNNKARLAPNGDIYLFEAFSSKQYITVYKYSRAANYEDPEHMVLELPEECLSFTTLQYRINDEGELRIFYVPAYSDKRLKVWLYDLNTLTATSEVVDLELPHPFTNNYSPNDLIMDETNRTATLLTNRLSNLGTSGDDSYHYNSEYAICSVFAVLFDLEDKDEPVLIGLAATGDDDNENTPSTEWAFGGFGYKAYSPIFDGGREYYRSAARTQGFFNYDHKRGVLSNYMHHHGTVLQWGYLGAPHFSSALAVVDVPEVAKGNDAQMRVLFEFSVTSP